MKPLTEAVAAAIARKPRSFDHIRNSTGLNLTDEQLVSMVASHPNRFKLVRFVKRDAEGKTILPGRPGLRLRDGAV